MKLCVRTLFSQWYSQLKATNMQTSCQQKIHSRNKTNYKLQVNPVQVFKLFQLTITYKESSDYLEIIPLFWSAEPWNLQVPWLNKVMLALNWTMSLCLIWILLCQWKATSYEKWDFSSTPTLLMQKGMDVNQNVDKQSWWAIITNIKISHVGIGHWLAYH